MNLNSEDEPEGIASRVSRIRGNPDAIVGDLDDFASNGWRVGPLPSPRYTTEIAKRVESLRRRFAWISSVEASTIVDSNDSDALNHLEVLRTSAPLIAVSDAGKWELPVFQFDREAGVVIPIVAYANRKMKAATDPWGALSWWETPIRLGGGKTPLELLAGGGLNEQFIDNVFASYRLGM
jgi:hypothetical protein